MSQPVLLKVYGGLSRSPGELCAALADIAQQACPPAEVARRGAFCAISFEGVYFPLEETLQCIRLHALPETKGRLDVLDLENWRLCRHEIAGADIKTAATGLNNVLDYSGF